MGLADQVLLTGATLALEQIRLKRGALPAMFDETVLREGTPAESYRAALAIRDSYAELLVETEDDDYRKISGLANAVIECILKHYPSLPKGDA